MRLKLPHFKASKALFSLRYFYILIVILLLASLAILGKFLYENFYETIIQSEEIIILKQEVAPDVIDTAKVQDVLDRLDNKTTKDNEAVIDTVRIPFNTSPQNEPIEQPTEISPPETEIKEATSTPEN